MLLLPLRAVASGRPDPERVGHVSKNKLTPWGWLRTPPKRKTTGVAIDNWQYSTRKLAELWSKPELPSKILLTMGPGRGKPISAAHAQHRAQACRCAQDLLRWLEILDAANAAGHEPLAQFAAFEVGRHEVSVKHNVLAHEEICRVARLGGQSRSKGDLAWQAQVETMMQSKGRSYTDVCAEIGRRSGVDGRTVRRHTSNPRRKN